MPAASAPRLERDTAVERVDEATFRARVDPGWFVVRGPNGGYVAAIILRAIERRVADPARAARSLTIHFVAPSDEGELLVTTSVEREGRSLTSCSARVTQDDRLVALAVAALSAPRPGPSFCDIEPPEVPPPDALAKRPPVLPGAPAIAFRWDTRWAIGRPPEPGAPRSRHAVAGGWIRCEEPQLMDSPAVAAVTDAWMPAIATRIDDQLFVPTIDLTIHFRSSLPHPGLDADDFVLAVFRTTVAADGFMEEDGEVWAPNGTLLAQSRQLAATIPWSR